MAEATNTAPAGEGAPDRIIAEVRDDLLKRSRIGLQKYGVTVSDAGLTDGQWRQHAYEEALDLAVYLKASLHMERAPSENNKLPGSAAALIRDVVTEIDEVTGDLPFRGISAGWLVDIATRLSGIVSGLEENKLAEEPPHA